MLRGSRMFAPSHRRKKRLPHGRNDQGFFDCHLCGCVHKRPWRAWECFEVGESLAHRCLTNFTAQFVQPPRPRTVCKGHYVRYRTESVGFLRPARAAPPQTPPHARGASSELDAHHQPAFFLLARRRRCGSDRRIRHLRHWRAAQYRYLIREFFAIGAPAYNNFAFMCASAQTKSLIVFPGSSGHAAPPLQEPPACLQLKTRDYREPARLGKARAYRDLPCIGVATNCYRCARTDLRRGGCRRNPWRQVCQRSQSRP